MSKSFFSQGLLRKVEQYEPYFALIVVIFHLLPFWMLNTFPTLDGPSHLYNANLIQHLLTEPNGFLDQFYQFNPYPVPNWTGHLMLMAFNAFLPELWVQKLWLTIYVLAYFFAFRWLIKVINPYNKLLSYLAFPFMFNIMLFVGFYNFSMAVVFMLLTLAVWISRENSGKAFLSLGFIAALTGLMVLTYFSHVMGFATLCLLLGIRILYTVVYKVMAFRMPFGQSLQEVAAPFKSFVITALLPGVAMLHYLVTRKTPGEPQFVDKAELLSWIYKIRPLVTFHFGKETPYLIPLFGFLILLLITGLIHSKVVWRKASAVTESSLPNQNKMGGWLVAAGVLFGFYLLFPKSDGGAGFISVRFCYLFFLVVIAGLASLKLPIWATFLSAVVALVVNFSSNQVYQDYFRKLDKLATSAHRASAKVEPNSTVLPLEEGNHWMAQHYDCYLGLEKPVAILQNYECAVGYFPLHWHTARTPNMLLGQQPSDAINGLNWQTNPKNKARQIDYCFVLGSLKQMEKDLQKKLQKVIKAHYTLVYDDKHCKLYQLKNHNIK